MSGSELPGLGTPSAAPRPTCGSPRRRSTRSHSAWRRSPLPDIAERRTGAQLVYRDPLGSLFLQEDGPHPLAYAVVSTRRNGERSPLSNIVSITPGIAPQAPELLPAILDEGRVCLEWDPPRAERPVSARRDRRLPCLSAAALAGRVRHAVEPEADRGDVFHRYDGALRSAPGVHGARDAWRRIRRSRVFPPKSSSSFRATSYPPPAPARLDALSEPTCVRLLWDPVDAPDLAGYFLYRSEGSGAPVRITPDAGRRSVLQRHEGQSRRSLPLHGPLRRSLRQREQPRPRWSSPSRSDGRTRASGRRRRAGMTPLQASITLPLPCPCPVDS